MRKVKIKSLPKAQTNIPDWRDFLRREMKVAPTQNLVGDIREVKTQPVVAESTRPANMPKAPDTWKDKSGKQIIEEAKAQEAYDALPEALKRQDVLTADTRSDAEKFARRAWTAVSHPMETIAAVNRGYDIPSGSLGMHNPYEGYGVGSPMTSIVDMAAGIPAFVINAGSRQVEKFVDNPLEYGLTNTLGLFDPRYSGEALGNYLDLAAAVPVARAASPLLKSAGKSVITRTGEVKNILFEPKLSSKQSSLYDKEKTQKFLDYVYGNGMFTNPKNIKEWDVRRWSKQLQDEVYQVKSSPEYKDALDDFNFHEYQLQNARMAKFDGETIDLQPYIEKVKNARNHLNTFDIDVIANLQNKYLQKAVNKLRYPIDVNSFQNAASGYFGKVLPIVGSETEVLKVGNLMPWETQETFDKLGLLGQSSADSYLGLPKVSHVFPDFRTQVSKISTPGVAVQVLNKVSGQPLMRFLESPGGLSTFRSKLTPQSIANTSKRLKFLQDNDISVDWVNPNNFMFDPATGEVGVVDLSGIPESAFTDMYDRTSIRKIGKFGVDYPSIYEKGIGTFLENYDKSLSPSLRRYPRHIDELNRNIQGYSFPQEIKGSGRIWGNFDLTEPQWEIDINNPNPAGFKKGGSRKDKGFQILTDTNGKYVFVKT